MGKVGWRIETVRGLFAEIFADGGDTVDSVITHHCNNPYSLITHTVSVSRGLVTMNFGQKPFPRPYPISHTFFGGQ